MYKTGMKKGKNNSYIKLRTQVGQFQGEDAPVKNLKKWKKRRQVKDIIEFIWNYY